MFVMYILSKQGILSAFKEADKGIVSFCFIFSFQTEKSIEIWRPSLQKIWGLIFHI